MLGKTCKYSLAFGWLIAKLHIWFYWNLALSIFWNLEYHNITIKKKKNTIIQSASEYIKNKNKKQKQKQKQKKKKNQQLTLST